MLSIAGLGLCILPFFRPRASLDPEGDDLVRAASEADAPFDQDLARWEAEFETPLAERLRTESEARFGPDSPAQAPGGLLNAARVRAGERPYAAHCIGCLGVAGDGAGPAARYLSPRLRNLRRGIFEPHRRRRRGLRLRLGGLTGLRGVPGRAVGCCEAPGQTPPLPRLESGQP